MREGQDPQCACLQALALRREGPQIAEELEMVIILTKQLVARVSVVLYARQPL